MIPNPIVLQRADPWVLRHGDDYLFTGSHPLYDRIVLRRAPTLDGLQAATEHVIWRAHATGPQSHLIWAPELHRIGRAWYIYFAAAPDEQGTVDRDGADETFNHRIFVLENSGEDPCGDGWIERGQLDTGWESFALDATTFAHGGDQYLVWAQQDLAVAGHSNLYIARMANPWTLASPAVELSRPEHPWEMRGFAVNEGPAVLVAGNKIHLTYSGAATGTDYAMGLLAARADADLLDPRSWSKRPDPVVTSCVETSQFGPGHNSFTVTADGRPVLVYHARNYTELSGDPLWEPNRHARAQVLDVDERGQPIWPRPVPDTRPTPSGTTVLDPTGLN